MNNTFFEFDSNKAENEMFIVFQINNYLVRIKLLKVSRQRLRKNKLYIQL